MRLVFGTCATFSHSIAFAELIKQQKAPSMIEIHLLQLNCLIRLLEKHLKSRMAFGKHRRFLHHSPY